MAWDVLSRDVLSYIHHIHPCMRTCSYTNTQSYFGVVDYMPSSGPKVLKLFSCSTQLSKKFIPLINVKMPTIVGILTFISMINTTSEGLKARKVNIFQYFSFL